MGMSGGSDTGNGSSLLEWAILIVLVSGLISILITSIGEIK